MRWQVLFALFRLWLDVMLWWMIGCACVTIRDSVTVSVTEAVCDVWQDWDQSQLYNFSWSSVPTLGPRCSTSPSHLKISLSRWTGRALSALSGQTSLITPHTNTQILTRTCSNFGYYWENYNWFSKMSTSDYGPSLLDALLACELCRALLWSDCSWKFSDIFVLQAWVQLQTMFVSPWKIDHLTDTGAWLHWLGWDEDYIVLAGDNTLGRAGAGHWARQGVVTPPSWSGPGIWCELEVTNSWPGSSLALAIIRLVTCFWPSRE